MNSTQLCAIAESLYAPLVAGASKLQSLFLLAVRLYWGWQFFITGWGKLANLDQVTGFFTNLHIPFPKISAIMVALLETFGGLLLFSGLASRLISIPLIVMLVVAYLTADIEKVRMIFSDSDKFVTADEFLFLLATLIILIFGPGKFSLDYLIGRKLCHTPCSGHPSIL